jgi:hypothetical protein
MKGLNNAFKITFRNVNVVGCDIQWKNCLLKRPSDDGLHKLYNSDVEFHLLTWYIWALSYVHLEKVVPSGRKSLEKVSLLVASLRRSTTPGLLPSSNMWTRTGLVNWTRQPRPLEACIPSHHVEQVSGIY